LYRHQREPDKLIDRLNVAQQILTLVDELIDNLKFTELPNDVTILKMKVNSLKYDLRGAYFLIMKLRAIGIPVEGELATEMEKVAERLKMSLPKPYSDKNKGFTDADGKPDEVKKVVVAELKKEPKAKHKSHIKGKHIVNALAQKVEADYHTKLTYERYLQVLQSIAEQPNATLFKTVKASGLSSNGTYAHIRYGQQNGDIECKKSKYSLKKNGIANLTTMKIEYGDKIKPIEKDTRAKVEGEYLTDEDAISIHKTMATPVVKERYQKALNILENHFGKKAKVREITALTGWSVNSTKAQVHLKPLYYQ